MVKFKYKNQDLIFPTSYEELTLSQFFNIRDKSKDLFDVFEILSGVSAEQWRNETDLNIIDAIYPFINFISEEPPTFDKYIRPDTIDIAGKRYDVTRSIGIKTLAQKWAFEDAVKKNENDVDLIPIALAIYFQPEIDGTAFNGERVEDIMNLVMDCTIVEAFPVAGFFFNNYKRFAKENQKNLNTHQRLKRSGLELIALNNSDDMVRFARLRRLLIRATMKCYSWIITPRLLSFGTQRLNRIFKKHYKKH